MLGALPVQADQVQTSPAELIRQMVNHGLQDYTHRGYWSYHVEQSIDGRRKSEFEVETPEGPVYRLTAIDGHPLNAEQQQAEDERLNRLLRDPAEQEKIKRAHDEDEQRMLRMMKMLPDGFLYDLESEDANVIRLRFRPNPKFVPPTYEGKVFHALAGTITIDRQEMRMREMQGTLIDDVQFGYGLLGRIEKGGVFSVARQPVAPMHWKTSRVDVHLTGRLVMLKTISRQQDEDRSGFEPVPPNLSLQQAINLVNAYGKK